jgi:hypothetical protein
MLHEAQPPVPFLTTPVEATSPFFLTLVSGNSWSSTLGPIHTISEGRMQIATHMKEQNKTRDHS